MKYRIVRRNQSPCGERITWYYAQMKVLGIWIDCRHLLFIDTYNSTDEDLEVVERWVEDEINVEKVFNAPLKEEIVKTYD